MTAITLSELTQRITSLITRATELRNVWVTAEISDLHAKPGSHCYLELVAKDEAGRTTDKIRATIWAQTFSRLNAQFKVETGSALSSGMKVMVLVTVGFHGAYGLAANITAINPSYTMGDLLARRNEILQRLQREGVLTLNRELPWCDVPLRIAIISAQTAAGYGDFVNQLFNNPHRLRFSATLFPAYMQGENAVPTVIGALEQIAERDEEFDCVVIIRGGGATTDFAAFENYDLASHIAQFPLPIIVGIGHERDVTVLDYVANMRVKTPTAAAEWLIDRGEQALERLSDFAHSIHTQASLLIAQANERLAYAEGALPHLPLTALEAMRQRVNMLASNLTQRATAITMPQHNRLAAYTAQLSAIPFNSIGLNKQSLKSKEEILAVLSPTATLRRGYTITRFNGKALTSATDIPKGSIIETTFKDGILLSVKE